MMTVLDLQTAARATAFAIVLILTGCVTPPAYGPIGHVENQYGYRDNANADGSHTILVVAATPPMAHEFWDRRAAEICGATVFHKNIFRAQRPTIQAQGYAVSALNPVNYTNDVYGDFIMEGYLRCQSAPEPPNQTADAPVESSPESAPASTTP